MKGVLAMALTVSNVFAFSGEQKLCIGMLVKLPNGRKLMGVTTYLRPHSGIQRAILESHHLREDQLSYLWFGEIEFRNRFVTRINHTSGLYTSMADRPKLKNDARETLGFFMHEPQIIAFDPNNKHLDEYLNRYSKGSTSSVRHDINNALTIIKAAAQMKLDHEDMPFQLKEKYPLVLWELDFMRRMHGSDTPMPIIEAHRIMTRLWEGHDVALEDWAILHDVVPILSEAMDEAMDEVDLIEEVPH